MRRRRVSALHLLSALAHGGALVDLSGPLANQAEARRARVDQSPHPVPNDCDIPNEATPGTPSDHGCTHNSAP